MITRRQVLAGLAVASFTAAPAVVSFAGPAVEIDEDASIREYARIEAAKLRASLPNLIPLTRKDHYHMALKYAWLDACDAFGGGADFDAEMSKNSLRMQLLSEHYDFCGLDGPTTERGFRHPSWPTTC